MNRLTYIFYSGIIGLLTNKKTKQEYAMLESIKRKIKDVNDLYRVLGLHTTLTYEPGNIWIMIMPYADCKDKFILARFEYETDVLNFLSRLKSGLLGE